MAEPAQDLANQPNDPLIETLRALLGDRLSTARAVREHHGKDASYHAKEAPDAVAFAETTEEVSAIVKLCAEHKRPVIAFGTGTSLEGQVQASQGGVCIDPGLHSLDAPLWLKSWSSRPATAIAARCRETGAIAS